VNSDGCIHNTNWYVCYSYLSRCGRDAARIHLRAKSVSWSKDRRASDGMLADHRHELSGRNVEMRHPLLIVVGLRMEMLFENLFAP
jgi:hypothetical protein